MDNKQDIVSDIKRVAAKLSKQSLSKRDYTSNGKFSISKICYTFGSWDRAIQAAGLQSLKGHLPEQEKIPDEELLLAIVELAHKLGKAPTTSEMNAMGKFSEKPYRKRWGAFAKARDIALRSAAFTDKAVPPPEVFIEETPKVNIVKPIVTPTIKPKATMQRKKVQFGESIDFRGLRFAPVNEQGVVYLFGMISRELGFLIESVRTDYPVCEGKRCVDEKIVAGNTYLLSLSIRAASLESMVIILTNATLLFVGYMIGKSVQSKFWNYVQP